MMVACNTSSDEKEGKREVDVTSDERFRSSDLWVMGPARSLCATLLTLSLSIRLLRVLHSAEFLALPQPTFFVLATTVALHGVGVVPSFHAR